MQPLAITIASLGFLSITLPAAWATTPDSSGILTRPTLFRDLPQSMEQLIGAGYQVVNIGIGLTGFAYLLKQDNKYVTCAVQPDRNDTKIFVSECRAMN